MKLHILWTLTPSLGEDLYLDDEGLKWFAVTMVLMLHNATY